MEETIQNWGYLALFFYSFGGGMIGLAVASVFSSSGDLNLYYVLIIAFIANFIGDQFLFYIAKNNQVYAKDMMKKHQTKIDLANNMMKKYGSGVILLQKYIYGIKTLIPLVIGLTNYDTKKFLFFNLIGSIIWTLVVGIAAYYLGQLFLDTLKEYKTYGIILLIIILTLSYYFFKKY